MKKGKKNKYKSFVTERQPLFSREDFIQMFHDRVEALIRREIEQHFKDTLYKSE